jgi:hypothetical protein
MNFVSFALMKMARIGMAVIMLLALIFRSLPDSVFNYFHQHTHTTAYTGKPASHTSVEDYTHNCHIEEWNFESFEMVAFNCIPARECRQHVIAIDEPEVCLTRFVSQIGRGPPMV